MPERSNAMKQMIKKPILTSYTSHQPPLDQYNGFYKYIFDLILYISSLELEMVRLKKRLKETIKEKDERPLLAS